MSGDFHKIQYVYGVIVYRRTLNKDMGIIKKNRMESDAFKFVRGKS